MHALIIELDTLFLGGFALSNEVLAERLEKYGIPDNDPYRFVRKFYNRPLSTTLTEILPKTVDAAHVERRLAATYTALIQQYAQHAVETIRAELKAPAEAGVRLGIISHLRQDIISEIFDPISKSVISVLDPTPISIGLPSEPFQAALVSLGVPTKNCLGLVASGVSVRSAMRIGLRTIAVPDPVIAFENCAGALRVIDHLGEEVHDTLKSHFGY